MLITSIKSKPVYAPLRADFGGRYHCMLGLGPGAAPLLRVLTELKSAQPHALENTRVLLVPEDARPDATRPGSTPTASTEPGPAQSGPGHPGAAHPGPAHSDPTHPSAAHPGPAQSGPGHPSAAHPSPAHSGPGRPSAAHPGPAHSGPPHSGTSQPAAPFIELGLAVTLFDGAAALLQTFRTVLEESLMGTRLYVAGPESFIGLAMQIALQFDLNKDEIRAEEVGTRARRVYCVHCRSTSESVRTNIVRCAGCDRWLLVRDHYSRRLAAYMGVMADAEVPGELPAIHEVYL